MRTINATGAKSELHALLEQVIQSHEPIKIVSERGTAVLISEETWKSIQETFYLLSVPGMRKSIADGMNTPAAECSEDLGW